MPRCFAALILSRPNLLSDLDLRTQEYSISPFVQEWRATKGETKHRWRITLKRPA
jgi:hypothetical protein